ncbi:MAG: tonB-system energizer ExbB [Alphaproteobacteria bacterium]|nr:tonB-system energizer ExbB [Alphaproteobacteria bacterium]
MGAATSRYKGSTKVVLMTEVRLASRLVRGIAAGAMVFGLTVSASAVLAQTTPPADPPAAGTPAAPAPTPAPGTPPAAGTPAAPAVGPDGLPVPGAAPAAPAVGPDGLPVAATPAPAPMQPKLGPDGKPIIGPDGQPVMEPAPVAAAAPPPPPPEPAAPEPPKKKEPIKADIFGFPVMIDPDEQYSLFNLFVVAHPVVKVIMIGLILASIVSWAVLISKLLYLRALNARTTNFINDFRTSNVSLQDMTKNLSGKDRTVPPAQMVEAAANEIDLTFAQGPASTGEKRDHLTQRIASAMSVAQSSNSSDLGAGMAFLATVGSIATFVGLFGTVWGIMYSFIGIAQSKSTNLAVVAPGIAEALLATAMGLFAAIPAVVFYNIFARRIAAYNLRLDNFSSELLVRVSRQLDQSAG